MKRFTLHMLIFTIAITSIIAVVLMQADGNSDASYLKISSPQKRNLIIGTSKAAQGLQPQVLKKVLNKDFYNYAFTLNDSPYGHVYFTSITKKLDTLSHDNTFILMVDAWSLVSYTDKPNDSINFREVESFLNKINNVTQSPNILYLLKGYSNQYYNLLKSDNIIFIHNNGWSEVKLNNNQASVDRRTSFTINNYGHKVGKCNFSENRFFYFQKTIDFLNEYGKVYLVRLPIHSSLLSIEERILPNLNDLIRTKTKGYQGYLDLSVYNNKVSFTDGVHLNKESGEYISKHIAEWILKQ